MQRFKAVFGDEYLKVKLSLLWLFVMLNYIYADKAAVLCPEPTDVADSLSS